MKRISHVVSAIVLGTVVSLANADTGSSACDNQKLIITNTTSTPIYLVDRDIKGNANFDNWSKNEAVEPFKERVISVSSGVGTRGNAAGILHFTKNNGNHLDTVNVDISFDSGWSNYLTCAVTFNVQDNSDFFVTSHEIHDGTQLIFYAKNAGFELSDYAENAAE